MALTDTVNRLASLLVNLSKDLQKVSKGNKSAAQRARVATIRLTKVGKQFRKESVLQENTPYTFVIYHEGAYPSFYPYLSKTAEKIRTHWVPLFEKYRISGAFEHHSHAFKKTFPLKGGKIEEDGIIYFGDGSWGVKPRRPRNLWYIDKKARKNACYVVELDSEKAKIEAVDLFGEVLDETVITGK